MNILLYQSAAMIGALTSAGTLVLGGQGPGTGIAAEPLSRVASALLQDSAHVANFLSNALTGTGMAFNSAEGVSGLAVALAPVAATVMIAATGQLLARVRGADFKAFWARMCQASKSEKPIGVRDIEGLIGEDRNDVYLVKPVGGPAIQISKSQYLSLKNQLREQGAVSLIEAGTVVNYEDGKAKSLIKIAKVHFGHPGEAEILVSNVASRDQETVKIKDWFAPLTPSHPVAATAGPSR